MTAEASRRLLLWLRRWILAKLRLLLDLLDDRLHSAQVRLQNEIAGDSERRQVSGERSPLNATGKLRIGEQCAASPVANHNSFAAWEARRSGVSVIKKQARRRPRKTAHDFDLQFQAR